MTKLTAHTLSTRALALCGDIDRARHELGRLALQARRDGVHNYLAIMKVPCQREESTISHWARTQEWIENVQATHGILPLIGLRYSFFEKAAQKSDRLSDDVLHESLWTWHDHPGSTLESFRAHLDTLAKPEPGNLAEIRKYLETHARQHRKKAEEYGLPARVRDGLQVAADALTDALGELEGERVTA